MAFTIPNVAVAGFSDQAEPDSVDIDILTAGHSITGVVSGCAVTAQASPNMTVAVASGTISIAASNTAVSSGNVTITTANGTNPRKDLVVVNNAGTKLAVAGTPASQPVKPAVPANSVALAEVYVPANDAAINADQITDKRVIVQPILVVAPDSMQLIARKTTDQSVTSSTTLVSDTALVAPVTASSAWRLRFDVLAVASSAGDIKFGWTFPAGATSFTAQSTNIDLGGSIQHASLSTATSPTVDINCSGGSTVPNLIILECAFVNGSTAGNVTLRWAQVTSSGTASTVKANSAVWGYQLV